MKAHNTETNFAFVRSLESSKGLGNLKLDFYDTAENNEYKLLKAIWFKKMAAEVKPYKKKITLTEFSTNTTTLIK